MPEAETIGVRLRRLRLERSLTQQQLAAPKYTSAYVSTIEADRRHPSRRTLDHFAERLGVDVDELVTGRPSGLASALALKLEAARQQIYTGKMEDAERAFEAIRRDTRRYELDRLEAKAEEGLGLIQRRLGYGGQSLRHYERALELLRSAPICDRAEAVVGAARAYRMVGQARYAIHSLESYLDELERSGMNDPLALMLTYAALVNAYFGAQLYEQAADAGAKAMALAPRVNNPQEVANMHINVARLLLHQGRHDDSVRSLQRAQDIYSMIEWTNEVARTLVAKGIVYREAGRLKEAQRSFEEALAILEEAPSNLEEARVLNELARVRRLSGDAEDAERLLRLSLPKLQDADVIEQAFAQRELALCHFEDRGAAEGYLQTAIALYERAGDPAEIATTYKVLGDLYREHEMLEQSCEAYRDGMEVLDISA